MGCRDSGRYNNLKCKHSCCCNKRQHSHSPYRVIDQLRYLNLPVKEDSNNEFELELPLPLCDEGSGTLPEEIDIDKLSEQTKRQLFETSKLTYIVSSLITRPPKPLMSSCIDFSNISLFKNVCGFVVVVEEARHSVPCSTQAAHVPT